MDRAVAPEKPSWPRLGLTLALSFLLGVTIGVAINMVISELRTE
jgi:uncharacterized protein involved in exopolysaccharide biosynthesis